MARFTQAPGVALNRSSIDTASAELGILLLRIQNTILHTDSERERRLRASEYERARVASNLEYARNSLTKLEHDALGIKAPGRRVEVQTDLNGKRELLELLLDRLEDLRQVAINDDDDDASTDGEDILSEIIPTPSDSIVDSIPTDLQTEGSEQNEEAEPEPPEITPEAITETRPSAPAPTAPPNSPPEIPTPSGQQDSEPTQTTQTLRPRGAAASDTTSAHSTARAALFANRSKPATAQTSTATAEALLDRQRAEQDALSESILKMAGALKSSSQRFSSTLEADKEVVGRAGEGMDKTERGMEAARSKMNTLKRGSGGFQIMGMGIFGKFYFYFLYACVGVLMFLCFALVFFGPKLRF
ncbi:hypothetical protein FSOLCH5_002595 [Fusarium solani]|uniref:Synaptobrevin n=1 Tax=Fusarium solani TaxID=169388 RepID=A0A9P9KDA9_FUSSL|nr:uncharacterized protein B0J15DRAFT_493446 [Fusarium solani]KAH7258252.1 hypothetical protein B0J15DRAFT_493446 [Fusarium solani]KAJ3461675.1 hypothetical protein MRS44_010228 [Fusarium solani]KAJ4224828.1 hypothetical protein NW759_005537 [Fusarium solani]